MELASEKPSSRATTKSAIAFSLVPYPVAGVLAFFGSALIPNHGSFTTPLTVLIDGSDVSGLSNAVFLAFSIYDWDFLSSVLWN